ncbi:IS630 family transposase, partial [Microcystis aeruginosa CS-1036]
MPKKKYIVDLTDSERTELEQLTKKGKIAAYKMNHARILLLADVNQQEGGWTDSKISEALNVAQATIERVRKRFVESGIESSLTRKKQEHRRAKIIDGEKEAYLIAIACSETPTGRAKWTLQMLADKMVELEYVEKISRETIRKTFKKNELKPWLNQSWVIPPKESAEFVCAMEDVLDIYHSEYDQQNPWLCFDESCKQLVKETKEKIPAEPREPERYDYQYERNGVANMFMFFEPLQGGRHVEVTQQRTASDYAHEMKYLVDERYPDAQKIRVIQDNLNTHVKASLYKAFEPEEGKRILDKLEFHYTPKHGSWLNMAEIELSVLNRQCLDRRIPDMDSLKQ